MKIVFILLAVIIGVWGPQPVVLHMSKSREQFLHLTTNAKNDSIRWEYSKGTCYSRQIASITIEGWRLEKGMPYFPGIVRGANLGSCELWLKSGDGEKMIEVHVMYP